jgi:hypothetical protein
MQVSGKIIDQIQKAILRIYSDDDGRFNQFCSINQEEFLIAFSTVSALKNYDVRVFDYLKLLNDKGTILMFLKTLFNSLNSDQAKLVEFIELRRWYDSLYTLDSDNLVYKKSAFQCALLKTVLAFVDREGVQDAVYRMISGSGTKMLIINGQQPQSGLSYIRYYLSEIKENTKVFELYSIDLKRRVKDYSNDGIVRAANIAQYISESLQMNYPIGSETFKTTPFVTRLSLVLKERKLVCMFFIDQFDVAYTDDVLDLIQAIGDLTLEGGNCYIILSGFEHVDRLSTELDLFATKENIGSFTRQHVQKFYKRIYEFLDKKYKLAFSLEEFLAKVENALSDEYFSEGKNNVAIVGPLLTKWFQNFHKQFAQDE